MVDAIAKIDVILCVVMVLELWAVLWLAPLGGSPPKLGIGIWRIRIAASPDGIRRQRLGRFLLPLILLVLPIIFFVPDTNPSPGTRAFEYVVVASTPFYVGGIVSGAVAMVTAGRQRRQRITALRQLHRRRQNMPS